MSRKWRALALVACAASLGGACNKGRGPSGAGSEVVARVAGRPITLGYYEQRLAKMDRRFLPDTLDLAGKRKFLDFIVNKELMAQKAEELKYGDDPRIASTMKDYEDDLAANVAIEEICKGKLEVADADMEAFYQKKQTKILAKHFVVKTRREAEELRQKALAGTDFDSLASQHSTVPRTDANTGEALPVEQRVTFGEVQFGEAMIPVEEAVFGTKIGDLSPPVETGYGWHVFKPISERQVTLPPLNADVKDRIEKQIQMRRKRELTEGYYKSIAKDHGLEIDEDAAVIVLEKLPPEVSPEQRPDPATEVKPVLPFAQPERDKVLFDLDGKKYTIGDFSDKYDATSWFERPKPSMGMLGIKYWIRDQWLAQARRDRARKDGIYALPQVVDPVKQRREQMMVNLLHTNLIGSQAPEPTEEQVRDFYTKHASAYVDKEKRRVNLIYNQQERVVRRAYAEIKGPGDFVDVAVRYDEGATRPEAVQTTDFGLDTPQFVEIAPKAFALQKIGDYTEPFKTSNFWVILQLANVTSQRPLQLDEIRDSVVQDVKTQWGEDKLNELLADWKKNTKIQVNDKVLGRAEVGRTDVYVPGRPAAEAGKLAPGSTP